VASHTISGQRWADGTTVSVYPAAAWPDPSQAPSGSAVTTAAVAGGAVTFTGLAENVRYVAYAGGLGVRFVVPEVSPTDSRALRTRVDELAGDFGSSSATARQVPRWDAANGRMIWKSPRAFDVRDFNAVGDGTFLTGSITATQNTLSGGFASADVGKSVGIPGAAAGGGLMTATINSVSAGVANLSATATTTVSGVTVYYGTDDTAAIQAMVDAITAVGGGAGEFPRATYVCNGVVLPVGILVSLRGVGTGVSGNIFGTRLLRTSDANPIISGIGTGLGSSQRCVPEIIDMELHGGRGWTDTLRLSRTTHMKLDCRIANGNGIGAHITNAWDSQNPRLVVEGCGNTGSFTANVTNANRTLASVSSFAGIVPGTVLSGTGLQDGTTVVSTNPGASTLLVDRSPIATNTGVAITTITPALVFDSTVGDAGQGNSDTVHVGSMILQSNFGTDLRCTGSPDDVAAMNDLSVAMLKAENKGNGTFGSPDTYPYIDLDYCQNAKFAVTRISMPTGRACTTLIKQTGVSAGTRSNIFATLVLDTPGTNNPTRYIDWSVGGLQIAALSIPGLQPTSEYIRVTGSAGRFKLGTFNHNSPSPYTGFVTDARTINEETAKGHVSLVRHAGSATAATVGSSTVWNFADPALNSVGADYSGQIEIPRDADPSGQCRVRLYWSSSVTTGNVHWRALARAVATGEDFSTAGSTFETIAAAPGTAHFLQVTTLTSGPTSKPGGIFSVLLQRLDVGGDDTLVGVVYLVKAEIIYDQRQ
jgi:hypothetical protein